MVLTANRRTAKATIVERFIFIPGSDSGNN
jgi:hypothetical protein